jgi:phage FluMu protein Com
MNIEEQYKDLERRCDKCNKLLFIVQYYLLWAKKLTINVKCPRCGEINHVVHHDFTKNTERENT